MTWYQNFLTHCEMIFRSTLTKPLRTPIWLLDCTSDDTMWNIHIIHIIIHMNLQELVLFCLCRSSKLPKTQPVSWPKCWNCEPKIVSILITCAFWKFHLHSCAVYVILHDTSIYILLILDVFWLHWSKLDCSFSQTANRKPNLMVFFHTFGETSHTRSLHCRIAIKRKNKTVRQYTASGESCSFCQKETNIFLHPKVLLSLMPLL